MKQSIARQKADFSQILGSLTLGASLKRRRAWFGGVISVFVATAIVWMGLSAWSQDTNDDIAGTEIDPISEPTPSASYAALARELANRLNESQNVIVGLQDLVATDLDPVMQSNDAALQSASADLDGFDIKSGGREDDLDLGLKSSPELGYVQSALEMSQDELAVVVLERDELRAALLDAEEQLAALVLAGQNRSVSSERVAVLEQEVAQLNALTNLQHRLFGQLSSRYQDLLQTEAETLSFAVEAIDVSEEVNPVWGMIEIFADEGAGYPPPADTPLASQETPVGSDGNANIGGGSQAAAAESDAIEVALLLDQTLAELERFRLLRARTPLGSPVPGARVSSHFGLRLNPVTGKYSAHRGIDLAAPRGTPVLVQAPGEVIFAGWRGSFGRFIEIEHADGVTTRYAHLNKLNVASGERVGGGQQIAEVGTSGRSTGPHLHYEILVDDDWVNPREWIKAKDDVFTQ